MKSRKIKLNKLAWHQAPIWKPAKAIIATLLLLSILLALFSNIYTASIFIERGFFLDSLFFNNYLGSNTLLSIHTGIGGILIALAFFVAQSAGTENKQEKSYVLLQHSYFFPLLTVEIFWFVVFLIPGDINFIGAIVTWLIGLFTVISLYRVTRLLSDNQLMERESKKALLNLAHEGLISLLDRDVVSRKANNDLNEKFKDNSTLSLSPFFYHVDDSTYYVEAKEKGYIAEIKSNKLVQLESYLKGKLKLPNAIEGEVLPNHSYAPNKDAPAQVIKLVNTNVEYDSNVFSLNMSNFEDIDFGKVEKFVKEACVIKEDNLVEDSRTKFRQLKDRCIEAIISEHTGELERLLLLYPELMTGFYDYVEGGLSAEQAHNESQILGQRIMPFDWFIGDIEDIFNQGIASKNKKIISQTAHLPIHLINHAIKHEDNLFFDGLLRFASSLYFASKENGQPQSLYLKDRSWRYLYELLKISMRLSAKHKNLKSENYQNYAEKILLKFQDLLKYSIDDEDDKYFNNLVEEVSELFDSSYFMRGEDQFEEVQRYLKKRAHEMFYGTAAWVLHLHKNDFANKSIKNMYVSITSKLAQTFTAFTHEFMNASTPEADSFWDRWHWWELEGKTSHKAHWIKFDQKLNALFVTRGLQLLSNKSLQDVTNMTMPYNRHLAHLAENNSQVHYFLNEVATEGSQWSDFIAEAEIPIKKVDVFNALLQKAKEQQDRDNLQCLLAQPISQEKVDEFKINVNKNYVDSKPISQVFKNFGEYDISVNSEAPRLAMNTLFDKAAFFSEDVDRDTTYVGLDEGFRFGESLMRAENTDVLKQMISRCKKIWLRDLSQMIKDKPSSDFIMIATNSALFDLFKYDDPDYKEEWQVQGKLDAGVVGIYKNKTPIYRLYADIQQDCLLLFDKNHIGYFEHHTKVEGEKTCSVDVHELKPSASATEKILEQQPDWLIEKGSKEQQIKHLGEYVQILVSESFSFKISECFEGYIVNNAESQTPQD